MEQNSTTGAKGGPWSNETHTQLHPNNYNSGLVKFIKNYIRPYNFLEFGCGEGHLANALAEQLDISNSYCIEPLVQCNIAPNRGLELLNFDLTKDQIPAKIQKKFDLIVSIEVAEHIDKRYHKALFDFLAFSAEQYVIFSGARVGQGGHGHVAERQEHEWRQEFVSRGCLFCPVLTTVARKLSDYKNVNHCLNLQVFVKLSDNL